MPKAIIPVLIIVLLVAVGAYFFLTGAVGKYSSPEKTLDTLVSAMEAGDVDAFIDCFDKDTQEMLEQDKETITSESIKADLGEYKKDFERTKEETNRIVMSSSDNGLLVFTKEAGGWKLNLGETMAEVFGYTIEP